MDFDPDTRHADTRHAGSVQAGTRHPGTVHADVPAPGIPVTAPRPPLPGLLAELGDDAWEAVDLALVELASRRRMLIDTLTTVNDHNLDVLVDNLRRHAHTVRGTAALLGDDVVVYAATALEAVSPDADIALRVQRLVDAIGRMIVRWSPIEDPSLVRWLATASSAG